MSQGATPSSRSFFPQKGGSQTEKRINPRGYVEDGGYLPILLAHAKYDCTYVQHFESKVIDDYLLTEVGR